MTLTELRELLDGWSGDYEVVLVGNWGGESIPLDTDQVVVHLGNREVCITFPDDPAS